MGDRWVGTYHSPMPIRCSGPLHFYSSRDSASGRSHVVVMAPRLPRDEAQARLAGLAAGHRLLAGESVPGIAGAELDGAMPWVALDCDAVADFESLTDFVAHGGERPPFEHSSTIGKTLMETLARSHQVRHPDTLAPLCLGSLSAGNLLFSADGKMWLVGFGAGPLNGAVLAPEVAAGAPPTPSADVYALTLFLRSHMRFTRIPPVLRRVFAGRSIARDARLVVLLVWSNLKILAGSPKRRPSMDEALAHAHRMWRLLGFEPDRESFAAWVARAVALEPERLADAPPQPQTQRILLGQDAEWLETPNGRRHSLNSRRPLRRLLLALAQAHSTRAGVALSVDELVRAGWPGEQPLPEAASNRVYVGISTLRKLGLGELLQRYDGGYRLDPAVPCRLTTALPPVASL